MLTVKQPFTMEGTSYQCGDRITDSGLITEALAEFPTSVVQTACAPAPKAVEATPAAVVKTPATASK